MARHHFYSRVPARVSLYNKIDGFDTFAKSAGLDRELVLGELSVVYKDKLDIHDSVRVRRGEIPTVYSQMRLSTGEMVHTAITYLQRDFTGERSAYLAHSMVLSDSDRATVFCGKDFDVFNPDIFVGDVTPFNLTARNAAPNPSLADGVYTPHVLTDPRSALAKYNPEMVKSFAFAILSSLCEGDFTVYFRLPTEDRAASKEALAIINAIMAILPYEMRERLSFVSYVSNAESYPGFKLKCISSRCEQIPRSNGVFYDFATGMVSGQPADFKINASVASFLYTMLENSRVRNEFHLFVSRISEKYGCQINDVKTFAEIAFLFWQCSGLYVEKSILPTDDAIVRFLDIYEKYREGMTPEHRVQAFRPLARYSVAQIAIPEQIFSRLAKLYPTECLQARAVALDVLLNLIHVDLMREKLFAFISRNYATEIDKVKAVVMNNLCRVFYGGFLQTHILSFFDFYFKFEPVNVRDMILDKLLLSIRTPSIQQQIVAFLDKHYESLNAAEKMKICTTCLEMMPECDGLSLLLVGLINRRIGVETGDLSALMAEKLAEQLDTSLRAGDKRLAAIFMSEIGFCEDVAANHILNNRIGGEIFIDILASMPAHMRAEKLVRISKTVRSLSPEDYEALLGTFTEIPVNILPSTFYDMIRADAIGAANLSPEVLAIFRKHIIYPTIVHTFLDVFKVAYGKEGIGLLKQYAKGKDEILRSPEYSAIMEYEKMTEKVRREDSEGAFKIAEAFPSSQTVRQDIADHILMCSLDTASQGELTTCIYELLINYLKLGSFRFDAIYSKYRKVFEQLREEESNMLTAKLDPADRRGAADAAEMLLICIYGICEVSEELARAVCSPNSGLKKAFGEFFGIYGVGAGLFLKKHFRDGYSDVIDIINELVEERNAAISSVGDAVDLILRRK